VPDRPSVVDIVKVPDPAIDSIPIHPVICEPGNSELCARSPDKLMVVVELASGPVIVPDVRSTTGCEVAAVQEDGGGGAGGAPLRARSARRVGVNAENRPVETAETCAAERESVRERVRDSHQTIELHHTRSQSDQQTDTGSAQRTRYVCIAVVVPLSSACDHATMRGHCTALH
jgi:hypothetical protein